MTTVEPDLAHPSLLFHSLAKFINGREASADQVGGDQRERLAFGIFQHDRAEEDRIVHTDVLAKIVHDLHPDRWRDVPLGSTGIDTRLSALLRADNIDGEDMEDQYSERDTLDSFHSPRILHHLAKRHLATGNRYEKTRNA